MKYVTRAFWAQVHDEYNQTITADQVIESDKTPIDTGLLDQHGTPVYRIPESVAFGFRGKVK